MCKVNVYQDIDSTLNFTFPVVAKLQRGAGKSEIFSSVKF